MTINELRNVLSTEELIEENPFKVLHDITSYVNNSETEELGRELVLRALEKRPSFRGYDEILSSLTRAVGLFPYLEYDHLSFKESLAYEAHRPVGMDEAFVLHRAQAEIYRRLVDGESVILSAPTSFGKSKIIDAMIATGKFQNIAVIVPTLALIDETRRRLSDYFRNKYKIITQVTQEPATHNIFIFTAERVVAYPQLPQVDFFVIDEFYKIGAISEDEPRTVALNQAFYRLHKGGGQFYMLGPNIRHIPDGLEGKFRCFFYSTLYSTVVSEVIPVFDWKDEIPRLISLVEDIEGQTLIYCRSPKRVNEVARALIESGAAGHGYGFDEAADWIAENYHPDWVFHAALKAGVGIHHGRLPRSLSQFSVAAFNDGRIKCLICTSTLIEGVNTKAKNVIILDNVIGGQKQRYDFFTFNNIKGRSGRMFHHFVGKVYVFHAPPQEELPFVDFPLFTQEMDAPESLLIQLEDEDLKPTSRQRLEEVFKQDYLPIDIIRANNGVAPSEQIDLAKTLYEMNYEQAANYFWHGIPNNSQIYSLCGLIWGKFVHTNRKAGVFSGKQLAYKTINLMYSHVLRDRIAAELLPGKYSAKTPDEAVERVLEFDRNWAGYELPRLVMTFSRIQEHVFRHKYQQSGDYSFFAMRLEALFKNPAAVALEEYGLPIQVTEKISKTIPLSDELDVALYELKLLTTEELGLSKFEEHLFRETQKYI